MRCARASVALLLQALVVQGPLYSPAWTARSHRPPPSELACTDFSSLFWSVSLKGGVPQAAAVEARPHVDSLPFRIAAGPDRQGDRYVEAVPGGWIVGFNAGEFGGGLWWFSADGAESRRISPETTRPVNPDEYSPENVVGLPIVGGERLVLMGLDHMLLRFGRILRLVPDTVGWKLDPVATLESDPDVWVVDRDRLLFLTQSGVWSTGPSGDVTRLYQIDMASFSPNAIVRTRDGSLYIGLRHYVLKLAQSNSIWHETWFTPAACANVAMRDDGTCQCVR